MSQKKRISDLSELENSSVIHDAVWTYNLCDTLRPEIKFKQAETLLYSMFHKLKHTNITKAEELQSVFTETVRDFEIIAGKSPLDGAGVYEYGGLNELFGDIMEIYGFYVERGKYAQVSNFVYPGEILNGN